MPHWTNSSDRMRVLMVDDDESYLSACAMILRADCHDVVTCSDFNEGRRRLAADHFDALIADVRLGAYNGLHLIALAPPSMLKIALTAFLDPVLCRDANRPGRGSSSNRRIVRPCQRCSHRALRNRYRQ